MATKKLLRRAIFGVGTLFFTFGFCSANWLSRIPAIRAGFDLNKRQLGLFMLISGLGSLAAFRVAPILLHSYPSRKVAGGATCAFACMLILPAASPGILWAAAALFAVGCCSGTMDLSLNANALQLERGLRRPILAALQGCCSLGGFCGAACGTVAASFHIRPSFHLLGVACICAPVAILSCRSMVEDRRATTVRTKRVAWTKPLILLGVVAFCASAGEGAMAEWVAIYLRDELHTSLGLASMSFTIFSASMLTGRFFGGRLVKSWSVGIKLLRCGLFAAASLSLGLYFDNVWAMFFAIAGVGAGLSQVSSQVFRQAARLPNQAPASSLAAVATLSYGGLLLVPPLIGLVAQALTLRTGLGVVVLLGLLMATVGRSIVAVAQPSREGTAPPHLPAVPANVKRPQIAA